MVALAIFLADLVIVALAVIAGNLYRIANALQRAYPDPDDAENPAAPQRDDSRPDADAATAARRDRIHGACGSGDD